MKQERNYYNCYDPNKIGERLRALRKSKGLSQAKLADEFCSTRASIISFEKGKKPLPCDLLNRYQKRFNVSADYILYGKEAIDKEALRKYLHGGIERFINDNF